jgi:hypothetical protein
LDKINDTTFEEIRQIETDYLNEHVKPLAPLATLAPSFANGIGIPPSRHSVYLWEYEGFDVDDVGNTPGPHGDGHFHPTASAGPPATPQEEGLKMCSNVDSVGPERRSLFVAIVNCVEHEEALNSGNRIVPVQEFAEVFLTELADHNGAGGGSGDKGAIYIELKRAMKPGDAENVVLRDLIQLY